MRLFELEQGYKMVKGVPEYQPKGNKVSPFYQKQLGPGWDQASRDKDIDDIMGPGTAQKRREIRADPILHWNLIGPFCPEVNQITLKLSHAYLLHLDLFIERTGSQYCIL